MALPTLRPQWVKTFKNPVELTASRLQREQNNREKWSHTNSFFKAAENSTRKNDAWTSERSYKRSMHAVDKIFSKAVDQERISELSARKERLRKLFADENEKYQKELKDLKVNYGSSKFKEMQERIDNLQEEKEQQRKKLAEQKMHEHWRKNEPRLRNIEQERNKRNVVVSWKDQLEEKELEKKNSQEVERRYNEMVESDRLKALAEQKEKDKLASHQNEQLANVLREQISTLQKKEEETEMLKTEESKLRLHNQALYDAEEKRKAYELQRKKHDHGRVLIRQYKQQLKQKSKQVQEALEFDLQILQEIAEKEKEEEGVKSARKEKSRADAEYMQQVVADQLRVEKIREAEVDRMFQEEAMRQWRKREGEWEREKIARERLMKSVLEERKQQIDEKMEVLHAKQKESLMERELLLEQMEEHQRLTHREDHEKVEKRKQREEEIREQITSRETERETQRRREEEEMMRQKASDEFYEHMLEEEAKKLDVNNEAPPPNDTSVMIHRRRACIKTLTSKFRNKSTMTDTASSITVEQEENVNEKAIAEEMLVDTKPPKSDVDQETVDKVVKQENNDDNDDNDDDGLVNYKDKYRTLKRKLKCLLYEQECFHEELRKVQRKCLRVNRDKSFLLDHLLKYEDPDSSSADDDMTESSDDEKEEEEIPKKVSKKIKKKSSSSKPKTSGKETETSSKNIVDKVRCKNIENDKQCSKLVSLRVKSGLCYAHRLQEEEKNKKEDIEKKSDPLDPLKKTPVETPTVESTNPSSSSSPQKHPGGKDISQIREAMEASSNLSEDDSTFDNPDKVDTEEEEDDLVIDVPK